MFRAEKKLANREKLAAAAAAANFTFIISLKSTRDDVNRINFSPPPSSLKIYLCTEVHQSQSFDPRLLSSSSTAD